MHEGGGRRARLGFHRVAKLVVVSRESIVIGVDGVEVAELEPLAGEVFSESGKLGEAIMQLICSCRWSAQVIVGSQIEAVRRRACCSRGIGRGAQASSYSLMGSMEVEAREVVAV